VIHYKSKGNFNLSWAPSTSTVMWQT